MSTKRKSRLDKPTYAKPEALDEPHALDRWIERWGEVFGHDETPGRVPILATAAERAALARTQARIHARGLLLGTMSGATLLGPEPGTNQAIWELSAFTQLRKEPPPLVVVTREGLVKTVLPRGTLFQKPRRTR